MTPQKGLWPTLERLPSLEAVLVEWQKALGKDFANAQPFLFPTPRQSRAYPCTNKPDCGCYHEVIDHTPDRIVAACRCEPRECKTIPLQARDTIIYALDSKKFSKAIREVFNFTDNGNTSSETIQNRWLVGTHSPTHSPVYFLTKNSDEGFILELGELISTEPTPFILLAPSSLFKTPTIQGVLQKQRSVLIPLASMICFKSPGKFAVNQPIQPILEQFKNGLAEGSGLVKTVERIDRNIAAVAKNKYELQMENEEMKRLASDGLFNFLMHIEPKDFQYFAIICLTGDRAKAARVLDVNERTFYDHINAWPTRGPHYKRMYQMISSVKKLKTKKIALPGSIQLGDSRGERENPEILNETFQKIQYSNNPSAYPNILQDVLNAILELNQSNWQAIKDELIPLLREEVPQ